MNVQLDKSAIALAELVAFLDELFEAEQYPGDPNGIYRDAQPRPVQRIGLALDPWDQLADWAIAHQLDALFLHRPWKLQGNFPADIGVISYHLAFDQHLTLGYNLQLAKALELCNLEILGYKDQRAIGMIGKTASQSFEQWRDRLQCIFGGWEQVHLGQQQQISRVAAVGAMTDELVREAAARGASVYLTGQFRRLSNLAVAETGISVVAIGHHRNEVWGLQTLANLLRDRWAGLEVLLAPSLK